MKRIKLILSLLEELKEFLPFEYFKKFSEKDKEVYAFIKLFERLGGKTEEVDGFIFISKSFEISLRLLNKERVILKEKKEQKQKCVVGASHYMLHSREHLVSKLSVVASSAKELTSKPRKLESYSDQVGFDRNPKTKMKIGNKKISRQNKRRRGYEIYLY